MGSFPGLGNGDSPVGSENSAVAYAKRRNRLNGDPGRLILTFGSGGVRGGGGSVYGIPFLRSVKNQTGISPTCISYRPLCDDNRPSVP